MDLDSTPAHLSLQTLVDFTGGVVGGVASVYVGQPLDTVKVKMQTFPQLYTGGFGRRGGGGAWSCFITTLKQEGVLRGLYAGTLPSLAAQVSENAILFAAYGVCQRAVAAVWHMSRPRQDGDLHITDGVADLTHPLSTVQNALAGSCAAFFSSFALCPTELVKCRMQAARETSMHALRCSTGIRAVSAASEHIGSWRMTRQIVQESGVRGLFRGFVPTLAREMPGYFFFFGAYEGSRCLLTQPGQSKDDIGAIPTMLCGGIGGVVLWLAIFPTDVIKSRMQVHNSCQHTSVLSLALGIIKNEGMAAMYKGLGPTLLRTFPATGALFLAYETTRKLLLPTSNVSAC